MQALASRPGVVASAWCASKNVTTAPQAKAPTTLGCARLRTRAMRFMPVMALSTTMLSQRPIRRASAAAAFTGGRLVLPRLAAAAAAAPSPAAAAAAAAAASASSSGAANLGDFAADDDDEYEEDDEFEGEGDDDDDAADHERGPPPPVDEAARQLAVDLAREASGAKAADVMVLDVAPLVSWTSYLVIASVNSRPQLMAVLARCEKKALESAGVERRNTPTGRSQWEALDLGSVVVHVMTPAQREAYALEDFYGAADEVQWWEDGEELELEEAQGGGGGAGAGGGGGGGGVGGWRTRQ
jgi:ribosome-associated protein